jgi:hypothetical protein
MKYLEFLYFIEFGSFLRYYNLILYKLSGDEKVALKRPMLRIRDPVLFRPLDPGPGAGMNFSGS